MRLSFLLVLFINCVTTFAQTYTISSPLDVKQSGVNKVLCMKNGNTLLFHFDVFKPIILKVFDSSHKEIATQKHEGRLFDIMKMQDVVCKGLFEINNEAVLFMEQEHMAKSVLIRMRFNSSNGTLIEEKYAGESPSQSKRTQFFVIKDKVADSYSIFFCTDVEQFKECKLNAVYYDNQHNVVRDVPLNLDRKKYDGLEVLGAENQQGGNCITLDLKKLVTNEVVHTTNVSNSTSVYGNDLFFFYIPKNSDAAIVRVVDVTSDVFPLYSHFTYNPFTQSLNQLVLSYRDYNYRFGTDIQPAAQKASLFISIEEAGMAVKYKWIKNAMANTYFQQQTDSTRLFDGVPLKMYTNDNGLSTVIYRSFSRYRDMESKEHPVVFDSYLGNFCITQFDDEGNELWGTVLPDAQFFKSYRHYYFVNDLSKRLYGHSLFSDFPDEVYNRQFLSQNVYLKDKNYYIVFNDYNKNFNNSIAHPGDTVYGFNSTNAVYYKMDRKKEVIKHYLFGSPAENEYKTAFVEGADFDEARGVYAALLQCKKGKEVSICMSWTHFE